MDAIAVKLKLPGQRGVCALLAIHEQHTRASAWQLKRARVPLVIVYQRFPFRTEEGTRPRTQHNDVRS